MGTRITRITRVYADFFFDLTLKSVKTRVICAIRVPIMRNVKVPPQYKRCKKAKCNC